MHGPPRIARTLGTMVAYGFPRGDVGVDLDIARRLGASCLEILPDWARLPDPGALKARASDLGLAIHSAHGCWGGQSISAPRVDLAEPEPTARRAGVDDLRRCIDWLASAGGTYLVVHPGGLSDTDQAGPRLAALSESLIDLAGHAAPAGVILCVENMPPGVHPGSRMADLRSLVDALDLPAVGLALDTGHANVVSSAAEETLAAGPRLWTTHVHDNNGRQDNHQPPGTGTVDWPSWVESLDRIGYRGPIMLECIKHLRQNPQALNAMLIERLAALTSAG